MKLLLLFALAIGILPAQPSPLLSARDGSGNPVAPVIAKLKVEVLLFEDLAQTTLTLSLQNTGYRNIEGEFSLPLPPGVTISGYQLEVDGRMRDSTVVEKKRARFAYESIRNQNIDPGYIERLPGNIYRTKIFPILPGKSKAVQITFCQALTFNQGHFEYHLPLPKNWTNSPEFIVTSLQRKEVKIISPNKLLPTPRQNHSYYHRPPGKVQLSEFSFHIPGDLSELTVIAPPYSYHRQSPKSHNPALLPPGTRELEIVWDSSESGNLRDHQQELALLDTLFKRNPNLTVHLTRLRLTPEKYDTFHIKNGDWQALRNALAETFYDGGTDLSSITPKNFPTLIFSDAQSSFQPLTQKWSDQVFLIDSQGDPSPYWLNQIHQCGGRYLNLSRTQSLIPQPVRRFTSLPDAPRDQSEIHPEARDLIANLASSQELRTLEATFAPSPEAITAHGEKHHLVSDFTTLIVLERFEDHLRYRIPPPEPELRKKYDEIIAKEAAQKTGATVLARRLEERRKWHARNPSWHFHALDSSIGRLSIWQNSLRKVFQPHELNPEALATLEKTLRNLKDLKEKPTLSKIKSLQEHADWIQKVEASTSQVAALDTLTYGKTNKDKIAIAINGFVNQPGKLTLPSTTTLAVALQKAGGISKIGSPSRVALYRNSRKTIFNLFSREFIDFPMLPGDLVVVQQANNEELELWNDPFVEDLEFIDYRDEPAIIPASREPNDQPTALDDPFGADDPFASGGAGGKNSSSPNDSPDSLIKIPTTTSPKDLDLSAISKQLTEGHDPAEIYRKLRPRSRYPDDFYLQLGDLFLRHQETEIGQRILSNLIETQTPSPTAYRKWAYLLARHSDWQGARKLLDRAARLAPLDHTITLDQAWVLTKLGEIKAAHTQLEKITRTFDPSTEDSLRLAEIAAIETKNLASGITLPLDLHIMVSSASGQDLDLRLTTPLETITAFGEANDTALIGDRAFQAIGVAQYSLGKTIPGQYILSHRGQQSQIVRLQIYRNWGRPSQTCEEHILLLPATRTRRVLASFRIPAK